MVASHCRVVLCSDERTLRERDRECRRFDGVGRKLGWVLLCYWHKTKGGRG